MIKLAQRLIANYQFCWLGMVICCLGSGLLWPHPVALADDAPAVIAAPSSVPTAELNATDIPSEKVDQFVSAYLSVAHLIDDRSEELQRAETETESRQLQRAIEASAFSLIQDAGLSRQDYFQLLGLANTDPEFRDRVLAQLEESER